MPIQRPSLQKTLIQMDLNRFYEKPVTRVSVALILSLLCIAFFAIAAIKPTLQTMAQLIKQIDEKKVLDEKLTQKINALTTAQRQLSEKETLFPILGIAIPDSPEFTQLLTVIEKLASEHGVVFASAQIPKVPLELTQAATGRPTQLVSHAITFTFTGSYENLTALMRDMVTLKRIIVIDRFDISPELSDTQSQLTLTLAVRAFSFGTAPAARLTPPTP